MKLRKVLLVLAAAGVLAGQNNDMGVTLQRAIRKENVEGDLKGAIDLYKRVVGGTADRAQVAKALLGLGECYEKQGDAEARKAYERLVKEFGDQAGPAREAQARLAVMGKPPGGDAVVAQLITRGPEIQFSSPGLSGRVTPDGTSYAFVDATSGNLAVRNLQSGAVKRLTTDAQGTEPGKAHATFPIPSRDSKQIAYIWNLATDRRIDYPAEVRVINVDGSGMGTVPTKLGRVDDSAVLDWTPDGKGLLVYGDVSANAPTLAWVPKIVPGGSRGFGFFLLNIQTGEQHPIVRNFLDIDPKGLSPDGRWILYSRAASQGNPQWGIYLIDTQTGQEKAIVDGPGVNRAALWVPGSDRIVFRSNRNGTNGIWTLRVKDGEAAGEPVLLRPDVGDYIPVGVSRDGSIFYGLSQRSSDIYEAIVDPATLRVQAAPVIRVKSFAGRNELPAWSPSGEAFAYYSARQSEGGSQVIVSHADGKETAISVRGGFRRWAPHWCGDGQVAMPESVGHLWYDARTGEKEPERSIQIHGPYQMNLSPDCQSAYVAGTEDGSRVRRIYRTDLATGKESELLIDKGEIAMSPLVSPDERWVALWGRLNGGTKTTLLVLATDGGSLRELDAEEAGPFRYSWTPDSKRLLISRIAKNAGGKGPDSEFVWVSVDGGAAQPVGIGMNGLSAARLNPDGKRLLFSATEKSNELWVLRNLPLK